MDLVTGGELFTKILKEGKLPETVARNYFQQLVDGIEYCHRRGVCHRDLKPENLLIDETTGELKITDFGLSAMKGASTTEELLHTQCGSPNYCAPEIIARHKQGYSGNKVDAWSCGIILFALLSGYLPFYDENTKVLYRMIQRDDVKFPKRFPSEARDLILRLLHKEPEQRFTLIDVKKHPWFLVDYDTTDIGAPKTGTSASPPAPGGRRKRRGHARKSSVDQAPRSAEFPVRKKSDRPDQHQPRYPHPSDQSIPPLPPATGQPAPPAIIDVASPRHVPVPNRPPAPPGIPSPPKSPAGLPTAPSLGLPPVPPPPTAPTQPMPVPPPTVFPSVVNPPSPTGQAASHPPSKPVALPLPSYPVPPYPGTDVQKKAREPQVPRLDTSSALANDLPPSDPASKSYVEGMHLPCFPPPRSAPKSTGPILPPPSPSSTDAFARRRSGDTSETTESQIPLPHAPVSVHVKMEDDSQALATPISGNVATPGPEKVVPDTLKAPTGSTASKTKWNVNVLPPPPTYAAAKAPVTTSQTVAEGDSSWRKYPAGKARQLAAAMKQVDQNAVSHDGIAVNMELDEKPLSLVERRKMQYNNMSRPKASVPSGDMEEEGTLPGKGQSDGDPSRSLSVPGMRFEDRGEMQMRSAYPTSDVSNIPPGSDATNQSNSSDRALEGYGADAPISIDTGESVIKTSNGGLDADNAEANKKYGSDDVDQPGEGGEGEEGGSGVAPLKERLAAAVARYRRIFRLGAKIGITSSPSFTSNKEGVQNESEKTVEANKNPSVRSDFFSRAKGVTGAWGIILSQELEEDSDSEDERPLVTEAELLAFSRLLDFWDNRRASANVPAGTEVILDDEDTSPLSEEDIGNIQSLLHKLEPKEVEEELTEVVDEGDTVTLGVGDGREGSKSLENSSSIEDGIGNRKAETRAPTLRSVKLADNSQNLREGNTCVSTDIGKSKDNGPGRSSFTSGNIGSNVTLASRDMEINTIPPPPPAPPSFSEVRALNYAVPPPPPPPAAPPLQGSKIGSDMAGSPPAHGSAQKSTFVVGSERGSGTLEENSLGKLRSSSGGVVGAGGIDGINGESLGSNVRLKEVDPTNGNAEHVGPPGYAAPGLKNGENGRRMVVTQSTVRDPFRPRPPPVYPLSKNESDVGSELEIGATGPKVRIDEDSLKGNRGDSSLRERDGSGVGTKRKSSANVSDMEIEGRRTMSRDSGRMHSGASGVSDGSGGGGRRRGHMRTPSRDEHATRGLFAFNMFNRRKSSAMTSFESDLRPDLCLLEIGKILVAMGCTVLMKKGENKMKCEAPIKHETLKISITCTQENNVSTVHLKKGRRDKSQVDAKEFFEFFQVVHAQFLEQVTSHEHE